MLDMDGEFSFQGISALKEGILLSMKLGLLMVNLLKNCFNIRSCFKSREGYKFSICETFFHFWGHIGLFLPMFIETKIIRKKGTSFSLLWWTKKRHYSFDREFNNYPFPFTFVCWYSNIPCCGKGKMK